MIIKNFTANCPMLRPTETAPCQHYIRPSDANDPGFCRQPTVFRCIEAMKRKLPAISYSSVTDFIHCKLRYRQRIIEGLKVRPQHLPDAIKLGQIWDGFIRQQYENGHNYNDQLKPLQLTEMQAAKINALMRAYQDLEIQSVTDGLLGCQFEINVPVGQHQIVGYVDCAYEGHITETKLSSRPDFFTQRENVTFQLGTYFMSNERWEYADVQITRVPSLQTGKGRYDGESPGDYQGRVYGDIVSRPAFYFIGWDRKTRTFGTRFWREEFDLDEIFRTYAHVIQEIKETLRQDSWYANNLACHVPTPCPYLPIKRTGIISDEIYEKKRR